MQLSRIKISNFRLLVDADLEVDSKTTLIVGRNNTGKTSFFDCVDKAIKGASFSFDDYSLQKRESLYSSFDSFMVGEIVFDDLVEQAEPISIEFWISYSLDDPEDSLGALSEFIIDVDEDVDVALIRVEYKLKENEGLIRDILEPVYREDRSQAASDDWHHAIRSNFQRLFEISIYAVNPSNPCERQLRSRADLASLFPIYFIRAERRLGEDGTQEDSLSSLISEYFEMNEEEFDPEIIDAVRELRDVVEKGSKQIQQKSDEILSELIGKAIGFGYPNGEELQLGVTTRLSIDEQIKSQALLAYSSEISDERLPGNYNGLGYKNLIKMEFLLAAFVRRIERCGEACVPLLLIEEPESHMHPQMQQAFAGYLETFLTKISSTKIQVFLTSHSAHVANTVEFSKVRYARKTACGVEYRNLNEFANKHRDNTDFIRKYLTITKCDLFFADKAIFVEGASERLLLPDMIEKCSRAGCFDSREYKLPDQYYTLIEVGGAYAHLFVPFAEFLDIPCLILTDLDSVVKRQGNDGIFRNSVAPVSEGKTTSNETLKWWLRKIKGAKSGTEVTLDDIMAMPSEDKTMGKCHIEFQTMEGGLCGRSLEEAIKNVNRSLYGLESNCTEKDIKFPGKSKPDFALNLIYEHQDYTVPSYIKEGLVWLNNQKVLE